MSLHTTTTNVGTTTVLCIEGVVDLSTIAQLHMELSDAVRRRPGEELVVDLDGAVAIDDSALGVLLGVAAAAREAGGSLAVVTSNDRLLGRLARTRFDRAVDVRTSIS